MAQGWGAKVLPLYHSLEPLKRRVSQGSQGLWLLGINSLFSSQNIPLSLFLLHKPLTLPLLSHSTNITMPQLISSSFSVNRATAAMQSLAARSRIPVHDNGSVVPATASRLPVKTANDVATLFAAMSISKPTTVKHTSASSSSSIASKSRLPIPTALSASKGCPPLRQHQQRSLAKVAPSVNTASVLERIAERRQRVIANLAPGSKRPTPPVKVTPTSTLKSSSMPSRVPSLTPITAAPASTSQPLSTPSAVVVPAAAVPAAAVPPAVPATDDLAAVPAPRPRQYGWLTIQMPDNYRQGRPGKGGHIVHIVQISDEVFYSESLIPSASTGRKLRARLPGRLRPATIPLTQTPIPNQVSPVFLPHTMSQSPGQFSPVYLPCLVDRDKIRGDSNYCPARPQRLGPRGNYGYGILRKGRTCTCCEDGGDIPYKCYNIPPNQWATTPAESGMDPHPPCKVRTDRPRKVRFADNLVHIFAGVRDPAATLPCVEMSKDSTTREEDFPEGFPLYEDEPRRSRFGFLRR